MNNKGHASIICSDMNRAFPGSLYTHLVSRSRALSTQKRGGMGGGIPPLWGLFLEGGLVT